VSELDDLGESITPATRPAVLIPAADWRPIDIDDLEPSAWNALRHNGNTAVVAGPGAGKTEFLAQRAAYLLQTGICPWPQRTLAISFKRDAAANLGRRVATRVPEHADRFVSMTFDAFTKGLVDRFASTLPKGWTMKNGYDIDFPSERYIEGFLGNIGPAAPAAIRTQVLSLRAGRFVADTVGAWDLPIAVPTNDPDDTTGYAALQWWRNRYLGPGRAKVDFVMLNRLAELLVRSVPKLRRALRMTYPFVFVDEFQDTTSAQFSFLASVFADGPTVTAVGDSKQRIMGWAGALPKALERFAEAFDATTYPLTWNFRSSTALVQMQHVVATNLDPDAAPAISKADADTDGNPAEVWTFSSLDQEAAVIADWIAADITRSRRAPADFALLARQRIADFETRFRVELARHDISVRNDDGAVGKMRLQDLLKNEIARLLLGLLRLADQPRGLPKVWREVLATLTRIHGAAGDQTAQRRVGDDLSALTVSLRSWLTANPPNSTPARHTVNYVLSLLDLAALRRYIKVGDARRATRHRHGRVRGPSGNRLAARLAHQTASADLPMPAGPVIQTMFDAASASASSRASSAPRPTRIRETAGAWAGATGTGASAVPGRDCRSSSRRCAVVSRNAVASRSTVVRRGRATRPSSRSRRLRTLTPDRSATSSCVSIRRIRWARRTSPNMAPPCGQAGLGN
jgi:superfamily I DNA/RNA helicase